LKESSAKNFTKKRTRYKPCAFFKKALFFSKKRYYKNKKVATQMMYIRIFGGQNNSGTTKV